MADQPAPNAIAVWLSAPGRARHRETRRLRWRDGGAADAVVAANRIGVRWRRRCVTLPRLFRWPLTTTPDLAGPQSPTNRQHDAPKGEFLRSRARAHGASGKPAINNAVRGLTRGRVTVPRRALEHLLAQRALVAIIACLGWEAAADKATRFRPSVRLGRGPRSWTVRL